VDPLDEWTCAGFATSGDGLLLMRDEEPHCLRCSGLDHLVFLPAGDATRTGRAHRAGSLTAVVARFSQTRKRYDGGACSCGPTPCKRCCHAITDRDRNAAHRRAGPMSEGIPVQRLLWGATGRDHAWLSIAAGHRLRPTFWNPTRVRGPLRRDRCAGAAARTARVPRSLSRRPC